MMRIPGLTMLILLVAFSVLYAQETPETRAAPQAPSDTKTAQAAPATTPPAPAEPAPPTPKFETPDVFDPTEELSEDVPAKFPVDI